MASKKLKQSNDEIHEEIFKQYDIRGIYPSQLTEEIAYRVGRAIVIFLKANEVVVGYDMRTSSPSLVKSLIKGITEQGADVLSVGLCSTPMLYYASKNKKASVMITASHNPKEYNGIKICRENAGPVSGDSGIFEIKKLVLENKFQNPKAEGKVKDYDIKREYVSRHLKLAKSIGKPKIVFDFANASGILEFKPVFEKVDCEKVYMFDTLDGNLPNHDADPTKSSNLKDLAKKVIEEKADIGIATDGDSDRVVFVDEKGNTIAGDMTIALISEEILKENPNEKIVYEVRSSWALKESILENGGVPVIWKPGHSFLKEKMKKYDVIFGGEKSGHFIFRDAGFFESPLMATFMILKLMHSKKKKLSELVKPLLKYYNNGTDEINMKVNDKDFVIRKVEEHFKDAKIFKIDGITCEYKDWWFNLRKSNTEPVIRLNLEAKTKDLFEKKKKEVLKVIESCS